MGEFISVDGFPLSGRQRGGQWKILDLEGWWDRPAVKEHSERREFGDGSYPLPVEYDERLITIAGRFIADGHEGLHAALNLLNEVAYRGGAPMVVRGHGPTQTATVGPRGAGLVSKIKSDKYVSYVMQLVAHDPFKYGEKQTVQVASGSTGRIFHWGNADAWPVATVSGSMPGGYTLRFRGGDVKVSESVVSGEPHRIDYRTRRIYIGGQLYMGLFDKDDFRPCPKGGRHDFRLTPAAGSGSASVAVTDTYI